MVVYKNESIELSSKFLLFSIFFGIVELLMWNFQNVLYDDSNYIGVLVC